MTEQLKPCPFCGAVGLDFEEGSTFRWLMPSCSGCGASCGEVRINTMTSDRELAIEKTKHAAVKVWNRRTSPAGYALVPIEPTIEMKVAGFATANDESAAMCGLIYKAMIESAPAVKCV